MATYYVRGSATASGAVGSNANAGTSWTVPKQTVAGALAIVGLATNDIIVVDYQGLFTAGAAIAWTVPAGVLNIAIISVVPSGTTGFTKTAGAQEAVGAATAGVTIAVTTTNTNIYVYGMWLAGGTSASTVAGFSLLIAANLSAALTMDECTLEIRTTGLSMITCGLSNSGASRSSMIQFQNTIFSVTGSRLGSVFTLGDVSIDMNMCSFSLTGANKPVQLFQITGLADTADVTISNMSFAGIAAALLLFTNMTTSKFLVKNCELSFTFTGSFSGGVGSVTLRNCSDGDVITMFQYTDSYGILQSTTNSLIGDDRAEFNGGGVCWEMNTTSLVSEARPFVVPLLEIWNETVGAVTAKIEITRNGSLTDRQIWSELSYPTSATVPLYQTDSNRNAAPFTGTGVAHPTSAETWDTPLTHAQVLEHTITTTEVGLLQARIYVAEPSAALTLNPVINLS